MYKMLIASTVFCAVVTVIALLAGYRTEVQIASLLIVAGNLYLLHSMRPTPR